MPDEIPKADRRGNTILVPIGIGAVFAVLVVLMFMRMDSTAPTPPPPSSTTQSK
jgi:hypothetical protein